jgi:Icc protein
MSLRLLVISDHHLGRDAGTVNRGYATAWALERTLDAIAAAGGHGADAILSTGDLVDRGDDAEYAFAREVLGVRPGGSAPGPLASARPGFASLPFYLVPGNHDPRDAWLRNLFPDHPPTEHVDLEWSVGGQAFVHLDLGSDGRRGTLRERSLRFLDRALARGRPVVLALHHHPIPVGIPWLDRALPDGIDRLWDRLGRGVVAVLFGHAHASVDADVRGVPVMGTRSTCFQFAESEEPEFMIRPLQYRLVNVDGTGVTSERYEVPLTGPAVARVVP